MVHLLDQMVVVEKSGLFSKLAQEFGALGAGSAVVDLHLVRQTLSLPGRLNRKRLKNKIQFCGSGSGRIHLVTALGFRLRINQHYFSAGNYIFSSLNLKEFHVTDKNIKLS